MAKTNNGNKPEVWLKIQTIINEHIDLLEKSKFEDASLAIDKLDVAKKELIALNNETVLLLERISTLKTDNTSEEGRAKSVKEEISTLFDDLINSKKVKKDLEQEFKSLTDSNSKLKAENTTLSGSNSSVLEEKDAINVELKALQATISTKNKELIDIEGKNKEAVTLNSSLEKLIYESKEKFEVIKSSNSDVVDKIKALKDELVTLEIEKSKSSEELKIFLSDIDSKKKDADKKLDIVLVEIKSKECELEKEIEENKKDKNFNEKYQKALDDKSVSINYATSLLKETATNLSTSELAKKSDKIDLKNVLYLLEKL